VGNTFGQSVHMRCHNQQSIPTANSPFKMDAETTNSGWRCTIEKIGDLPGVGLVWYYPEGVANFYLNTGWQHTANGISTIVPIDFIKQGIQKIFHIY